MYNNENENNELNINEPTETTENVEFAETVEETAEETEVLEADEIVETEPLKERKTLSRRAKFRTVSGIMTALVIAAVIVVNLLIGAISSKVNTKIDLTAGKVLDFADETIEVAKKLDKEVNIYSLIPEGNDEVLNSLDQILVRYQQLSSKIKYERIDTVSNPQFLQKYMGDNTQFNVYSVIFECGDKFRVVDINDTIGMNQQTGQVQSLSAEQKFTSALMYVSNDASVKVGVVQGHNEVPFDSFDSIVLEPENYDAVELNLSTADIPEDVNMLIIASPQRDFTPDEIDVLDAYFDRGGRAQLLIDFSTESLPVLEGYLKEWGVTLYSGFIMEESTNKYINYPNYIIPEMVPGEITDDIISNNILMAFPIARGMEIEKVSGVERMDLLISSDTSYVRKNLESTETTKTDDDIDGPVVVATMLSRFAQNSYPKFMIVGGTGIFQAFDLSAYANKDFYYNSLAFMTDSPESIYIRPKDISPSILAMPAMTALIFAGITVILIPLIILIAGFIVWFKRRHL